MYKVDIRPDVRFLLKARDRADSNGAYPEQCRGTGLSNKAECPFRVLEYFPGEITEEEN